MKLKHRNARLALLGGCALLLAACQQAAKPAPPPDDKQGQVSYRAQQPASGQPLYQLAEGQVATQPAALAQPAPLYPPDLVSRALAPVDIHAQLAVNGEGKVYNVIVPGEANAAQETRAFIAAVRQAVAQWRFSPLVIDHYAIDDQGFRKLVSSERPPFSQFYVFHFEVRDGKAISSMGQTAGTASSGK